MRRWLILLSLLLLPGLACASTTQSINPIPSFTPPVPSNWGTLTRTHLLNEAANRQAHRAAGHVQSGGVVVTSSTLTTTINAVVAYAADGHYVQQDETSLTNFGASRRTFLYLSPTDADPATITGGTGCTFLDRFTRVLRVPCSTGSGEPDKPLNTIPLWAVDTDADNITTVTDLRPTRYVGEGHGVDEYQSLAAAVTALGTTTQETLVVNRRMLPSADATLTRNIRVRVVPGGRVEPVSGVTVTINCLEAGRYTVINSRVDLGICTNPALPEWTGADASDSASDSQALIDLSETLTNGHTVYFGPGTYSFGTSVQSTNGSAFNGLADLTFECKSQHETTLRRIAPTNRIMQIAGGSVGGGGTAGFTLRNCTIDANGVADADGDGTPEESGESFGGINVRRSRVHVYNNRFIDSNPTCNGNCVPASGTLGRYAFTMGGTAGEGYQWDGIYFHHNIVEWLVVEINAAINVFQHDNRVSQCVQGNCLGGFIVDGCGASPTVYMGQYYVYNNLIIDPWDSIGISVLHDGGTQDNCIVEHLGIYDNTILFTSANTSTIQRAISLGTSNSADAGTGSEFRDLNISHNRIFFDTSLSAPSEGLFAIGSSTSNITFTRATIHKNVLNRTNLRLDRFRLSTVTENDTGTGTLSIAGGTSGTLVKNNWSRSTGTGFQMDGSSSSGTNILVGNRAPLASTPFNYNLTSSDYTDDTPHTHANITVDATTLSCALARFCRVSLTSGARTLNTTPTIPAGRFHNQVLTVRNVSTAANALTLQNESSLPGSTLRLANGANAVISQFEAITLMWDATSALWFEVGGGH